jgi:predicted transcriptional regulator
MKTVRMTLDETLVRRVDRIRKRLRQSRSAFTRDALREHLARYMTAELERRHREETVAKGRLGALITTLGPEKPADVARALRFALDL